MQKAIIDLSKNCIIPVFHAKQGDTSRRVAITLLDNGLPYDTAADAVSVWYSGPSGEGNYSDGIEKDGSTLTILVNPNMTAASGRHTCAVMLSNESGRCTTWNFCVEVAYTPALGSEEAKAYFEAFDAGELAADIAALDARTAKAVAELNARVSAIIASGTATEGNTELIDIRTGANGKVYQTAGDAVRGQIGALSAVDAELRGDLDNIQHGLYINHTQTSSENFSAELLKGKKYSISVFGTVGMSLYLSPLKSYSNDGAVQLFNNIKSDIKNYIFEADKDYFSVRLYQASAAECRLEVREVSQQKASCEILSPTTLTNATLDGDTIDVVDSNIGVSTPIYKEKALYVVSFPSNIKAMYNIREKKSVENRVTIETSSPFLVKNDSEFRVTFFRADGKPLTKASPWFDTIINIYKVPTAESYDITIAQKDTQYENTASIVVDDSNATHILAALFGSYHSIKALVYPGNYNLNNLYAITDKCHAVLPFCNYNINSGSKERRLISIHGMYAGCPQTENSVNFVVSSSLHSKFLDSGVNNFLIGGNYDYGAVISRLSTSVDFKNINIIGYGYDKPVTYVDTSRCLSTQIENVNVRSWAEHLTDYVAFDNTPNTECCGIRVGRGSNYGIGNYVKHLNVWYCGKGIACNGEHFIFEDVKTHHDYIGFYFGDKPTVGKLEHTNTMIGCSIEGCYRLMVLSKNGVITEQDFVIDDTNNMLRSTLDVFSLSTEKSWIVPTNEDNGGTKQTTLPILEIVKGAYRGRMELENYKTPFEKGSGANFLWIAWSKNGVNTSNYIDFSAIN